MTMPLGELGAKRKFVKESGADELMARFQSKKTKAPKMSMARELLYSTRLRDTARGASSHIVDRLARGY